MKNYILSFSILTLLMAASCNNAKENSAAAEKESVENNSITFRVDGQPVRTSGWNISRFESGQGLNLNITTNMHEDKRTVMVNLRSTVPGTYSLDENATGQFSGYGDYKPDYEDLLNSYRFTRGSFTISSIDTSKGFLNATFSATAKKGSEVINITDGKVINGSLNKNVITY